MRNGRAALAGALALVVTTAPALGQSGSNGIVEDALRGVRQDQARDSARVRQMVDEAVRGAEGAPSGQDMVNPTSPPVLQPLTAAEAPGALPAGYRAEDLVGQPVDDGTGGRIGTVRGVVRDEASGVARAMVDFAPLFGQPAKTSAVPIEALTTANARGEGWVMELTTVDYARMPSYVREGSVWRQAAQ